MKIEMTLDEIHEELLEQLRDITKICDAHGIEYNLMCGTLLGAVRHKGFIPWDDDVDLLMTREEFTKFRKVYPEECDRRFELTYLDTWTPRVMNRDPEKAAAFTDFFILDPLPPEGLQRKLHLLHLHLLQGMMKKNVDYSRFGLKNRILLRANDEEECGLQPLRTEEQDPAARDPSDGPALLLSMEGRPVRKGIHPGQRGPRPAHEQRRL